MMLRLSAITLLLQVALSALGQSLPGLPAPMQPRTPAGVPELILTNPGYVVSYNTKTHLANWVAWTLIPERLAENHSRKEAGGYRVDDRLSEAEAVHPRDYSGSGWSRGHLCPAADNRWNLKWLEDSNIMTNFSPQSTSLNSGLWNRLEGDCRRWAREYGVVYIVCGPIYYKTPTSPPIVATHDTHEGRILGTIRIPIPDAYFKVVYVPRGRDGNPMAIGFVAKNLPPSADKTAPKPKPAPRETYVNSVAQVERLTGYDFFGELPDEVERRVEAMTDWSYWER